VSQPLIGLINLVFQVFTLLILAEVIGSWVLAARARLPGWVYTIFGAIHTATSPILTPIRRIVPSLGGLDLSPIIALVVLEVVRRLIMNVLVGSL